MNHEASETTEAGIAGPLEIASLPLVVNGLGTQTKREQRQISFSMNKRTRTVIYLRTCYAASVLLAGLGAFVSTNVEAQAASEPHTAAAVIAVDQQWSKAEDTGDAKYLNALLLPEYRSISSDGSTHDKATIIADAIRSARTPEGTAKTEQWLAAHPNVPVVQIHGDLAVLTFILQRGLDPRPVMSCDIFLYRGGHWRALYSQHTEAGK